ncbi:YceD family protein [Thiolapillus sp.]
MSQRIPDRVDPRRLAREGQTLSGSLPLDSLPRLAALLQDATKEADFSLRFGRDRERRFTVDLALKAELVLECQRCLESMVLEVDTHTPLALVAGPMEAEQLPAELDPLTLAAEEYLDVAALVEDELLLAIPASPRHADAECSSHLKEQQNPLAERENDNPFAILAKLRDGENHN